MDIDHYEDARNFVRSLNLSSKGRVEPMAGKK